MNKIKFGIIGMGARGDMMAKYFCKNDHIDLVAICDNCDHRLDTWKGKVPNIYNDYKSVLENDSVDSVLIATPDDTHEEIGIEAIKSHKNIILEKPLGIHKDKVLELYEKGKGYDKVFMTGYVLRYASVFKKAKELLDEGIIGKIITANVVDNINYGGYAFYHDWHREKGNMGSILLQKASHSLDILNWIVGSDPYYTAAFGGLDVFGDVGAKKYFGKTVSGLNCRDCEKTYECPESLYNAKKIRDIDWAEDWPDSCVYDTSIDIDDNNVAIIKYKNNVKASYTLSQFTPEYKREFQFLGDKGKLVVEDGSNTISVAFRNSKDSYTYNVVESGNHGGGDDGLIRDFIDCYYNGKKPVSSFEDGIKVTLLSMAMQESIDKCELIKIEY
jgi:predicted dehydrogenase